MAACTGVSVPTLITSGEVDWQMPTRYGLAVGSGIDHEPVRPLEMADEWNA